VPHANAAVAPPWRKKTARMSYRQRFEPRTSRIQNTGVTLLTARNSCQILFLPPSESWIYLSQFGTLTGFWSSQVQAFSNIKAACPYLRADKWNTPWAFSLFRLAWNILNGPSRNNALSPIGEATPWGPLRTSCCPARASQRRRSMQHADHLTPLRTVIKKLTVAHLVKKSPAF
jgi:hypothetical protein